MSKPNKLGHGGRLRFLAKDAAVYGIGGALTKLLSLITFPLLARHFSVQDFGLIDLLNTAVLLLSVLLAFGLNSAVARFFYENEEIDYRRQIVSQALTFQIAILAVALPLLWVNTDVLGSFIEAGPNGRIILHLLILQSPLFVLLGFAQSLLKWTFRRWLYMLISLGSVVMTVIGLVVGIAFFNFGVVEVFIVYLATRAIFAIIGLWCVRRWLTIPAGWDRLREMLPFAAPIGVVCVMGALLPFMERSMVQLLLGAEDLGLYAAGAKVGMLISLPMSAFEIAWGPFALSIFKEKDASESFRHVLRVFAVLIFMMVLALTALAGPVLQILGSARYEGGAVVVFAVAMGLALQAVGSITSVGIVFSKKSYLKLYGYGAMIAVAAIAIPLLSSVFGFAGVAWGSMSAYLARTILETWLAERVHPIMWDLKAPIALGSVTLLAGAFYQATYDELRLFNVSLAPLLGMAVLIGAAWFLVFDSAARTRMMIFIRPKRLA